jgi:hypothetical protein
MVSIRDLQMSAAKPGGGIESKGACGAANTRIRIN